MIDLSLTLEEMLKRIELNPKYRPNPLSMNEQNNLIDYSSVTLDRLNKKVPEQIFSKLDSSGAESRLYPSSPYFALENCWMHAKNTIVAINVYLGLKGIIYELRDSGKGFDVEWTYKKFLQKKQYYKNAGCGFKAFHESLGIISFNKRGNAFRAIYTFKDKKIT
jgi:hypothetical protein